MDLTFKALADSSRRELINRLHIQNGQTLRALCADLSMTRQAVTKHLGILEEAGIVTTDWRGREKLHFLNRTPLLDIATGWFKNFSQAQVDAPPRPGVFKAYAPRSAQTTPRESLPTEIDGESRWSNL